MGTADSTLMHFVMGDDGVVRATSKPGVEPTIDLLREAEAACRLVRGEKRRPAVWDVRQMVKPNPTAWISFMETAPNNLLAIAIVGDPLHIELLGSIPEIMGRLLLPVRLFTNDAEALEWAAARIE